MIDNILVIKVGTNVLVDRSPDGVETLLRSSCERIAQQVLALRLQGLHVAIVCSGAVTAGMVEMGMNKRPPKDTQMPAVQWLASVGWGRLMEEWRLAMAPVKIGGLLLTRRELDQSGAERNEAMRTLYEHFDRGTVPVINENDPIAHEEITFGDNDILSATIAREIVRSPLYGRSVRLVLLSDVSGVYRNRQDDGSVIRQIDDIAKYEHLAAGTESANSTGGMASKFRAAAMMQEIGVDMWVTKGRAENTIARALDGEIGTHFASGAPVTP